MSLNQGNVAVSHHKNRIYKNKGKTEKEGHGMSVVSTQRGGEPVCCSLTAWCSHSQTCSRQNPSVVVGGRGRQTKGWDVPNCLVSISSSQWQGFPAYYFSHTVLWWAACMCTYTHTQASVTDSTTLITWSVAYSQIPIWLLAPGPEYISEKKYSKNGFSMDSW